MTDTLSFSTRRIISPFVALVAAIALLAALALGFGLRAWTEHTSRPAVQVGTVHRGDAGFIERCRIGKPC
jgi:hypothetical protein